MTNTPTHWSYSQINTLLTCGEQYRLERVVKVPRLPAWWFIGGTAFHEATERLDRIAHADETLAIYSDIGFVDATWNELFAQGVEQATIDEPNAGKWQAGGRTSKQWPNGEDGDWWNLNGRAMLHAYGAWRNANPHYWTVENAHGEPMIEPAYTIEVDGIPVKGGIDRVFVNTRTGDMFIVDLKTGSRTPDSDTQLGHYRKACSDVFGLEVSYGAFYMARKAELSDPYSLGPESDRMVEFTVRKANVMRENEIYIPKKSSLCGRCGVRDYCWAVGGSKSDSVDSVI